jgi:anaerobic selenocysteine-containing dehydrogenase
MFRAILTGKPYPVKAVITIASNPMSTPANTKLVHKALKSLELYVVMDYWLTPSAELADYVLPVASWLERPHLNDVGGQDCHLMAGEKALPSTIPGEYEHRTDYEILRGLGIRLGQEEYWPWENLEQAYDYRLKAMGISLQEFMDKGGVDFPTDKYNKYEEIGFATPTGKVELYSTIFEKLGYDPLPRYEESHENPFSTPQLAEEYPLMLITGGRFRPMYHSEHRNIDSLRKRRPHPLVQINPETARKLSIEDGDWVWIESPRGRVRMKCKYFTGIDPRVVHAEHGWWFPELPGEEPWLHGAFESNVNVLTDDDPDACNKLSGGWPLKTGLCKVYRCQMY